MMHTRLFCCFCAAPAFGLGGLPGTISLTMQALSSWGSILIDFMKGPVFVILTEHLKTHTHTRCRQISLDVHGTGHNLGMCLIGYVFYGSLCRFNHYGFHSSGAGAEGARPTAVERAGGGLHNGWSGKDYQTTHTQSNIYPNYGRFREHPKLPAFIGYGYVFSGVHPTEPLVPPGPGPRALAPRPP